MRTTIIILAALLLTTTLALPNGHAQAPGTVRLTVFGDTGTSASTQANVNLALSEGSQGYLGLGDYEYTASPSQWLSIFKPLTDKGHWMAFGNHDDAMALPTMFAQGTQWSAAINGARVVSINTEVRMDVGSAQYNNVRSALCNAPEPMRVLTMHKPWWLVAGATHPGSEFPGSPAAMDQLVKDCKVSLVLAGHEHNYQRMTRNGAVYAIVGTGGESLYANNGMPSGTIASCSCYGHVVLDISASGYQAYFETTAGQSKDAWSATLAAAPSTPTPTPIPTPTPTPTPAPGAITFTSTNGNMWWVQTTVTGATPTAVDARDTGGAWVPLTYRSWGAWAGSFLVESGHQVQYRAKLADGSYVESCWFTHPAGVCATTPTPTPAPTGTFQATFVNMRGNAWWVETDVTTSGGTLAGVDASINGGAWVPLAKTAWGSWAKSLNAPAGSQVRFQARASDGQSVVSAAKTW